VPLHAVSPGLSAGLRISVWLDLAIGPCIILGWCHVYVWSLGANFRVEYLCFFVVQVLTRIGCLVLEHLYEHVEAGRQKCPKDWAEPVDPVVMVEVMENHARTEGPRWIERPTSVVDAYKVSQKLLSSGDIRQLTSKLSDEQRQPDANRGDESSLVLLRR